MSPANQSQPIAEGDLNQTPFAHLMLYLQRRALSGTLVVEHAGTEVKVLFRNGLAVAARGLVRSAALHAGLLELCNYGGARYAFWDGDLVGDAEATIKGTVDPFVFVAQWLRGPLSESVLPAVLDRYRGVPLRAVVDADPKRLGLRGAEAQLLEVLRAQPLTTEALASRSLLSADEIDRVVYLLLVTHFAAPEGGGATGTSGVRSSVSARPPTAKASTRPAQGSIRPAQRSGPPRARSLSPAWQQLTSLRAVSARSSSRIAVPSTAAPPFETLDDAGKMRRAEQLAEHRNFVDAARILDELIARDPYHAAAQALRAWTIYEQWTGETAPRALLDTLERALRLDELNTRALYVKGLVHRRLGKETEALRCFQRVVQADPRHVDAQRELRLARMRRDR